MLFSILLEIREDKRAVRLQAIYRQEIFVSPLTGSDRSCLPSTCNGSLTGEAPRGTKLSNISNFVWLTSSHQGQAARGARPGVCRIAVLRRYSQEDLNRALRQDRIYNQEDSWDRVALSRALPRGPMGCTVFARSAGRPYCLRLEDTHASFNGPIQGSTEGKDIS